MTKAEILKLKRQSRAKWRKIVKDLCFSRPRLCPRFTHENCSYCWIYKIGKAVYDCSQCVLGDIALCDTGGGAAFRLVCSFYCHEDGGRIAALEGAVAILVAIERDIEGEEGAE